MTKISDIYDAIVLKIETALPTYARLPNPYDIEDNSAVILRKAYGIAIGGGVNTERFVGCLTTWSRDFTVGLVTQVVNLQNDALNRALIEKALLDAHRSLLLAFETDPSLGGIAIKCVVVDDTGISYLAGERGKFVAIELGLSVEYMEPTV